MKLTSTRLWALCILIAAGCHGSGKRQPNPPPPPVVGRGTPAVPPKPLAIPDRPLSPARLPDPLDDKQSMIPKPPSASDMALPHRKEPATGLELAKAGPTADNVQTIGATETAIPDARAGDTALESMRQQHLNAVTAWSKIDAFDARLTRRESINGKTTPQEVIHFMFRKEPYSVRLKWIGTEGQGFKYILDGLNAERTLIAAECIGDGRWFIDKVSAYVKERVVFGRPIGQNQGVQFPIAQAHIEVEAADLMRWQACRLFDAHQPCGAQANMAKYLAAKASWEAANAAIQFHGGFGFAAEYDVERKFRETRLYQVAPISTNLILSYIAEHILGLPRSF